MRRRSVKVSRTRQPSAARQGYRVSWKVRLQVDRTARPEPVPCPICGRPLKWTANQRLSAFECDRCGQFSDFGGASSSPTQSHSSPPPDDPFGPKCSKPGGEKIFGTRVLRFSPCQCIVRGRIGRAPPSFSHRRTSVPSSANGEDSRRPAGIHGRSDGVSVTAA